MTEWKKFRIGLKEDTHYSKPRKLTEVRHIVHLSAARRILEDGRLTANIIYDESKLNKSRIAVTWLSANIWGQGSIYGNVEFVFPWRKLRKKKFYWVEAMDKYRPTAYRILMTDRSLNSRHAKEYCPKNDHGPLRRYNGDWYWNGDHTSEFMLESNIDLQECSKIKFIDHHPKYCRPSGHSEGKCPDQRPRAQNVAAKFTAYILGQGLHDVDHAFEGPNIFDLSRPLSDEFDLGLSGIQRLLGGRTTSFGGTIQASRSRKAVLRGALSLYGAGQIASAKELIALIKNKGIFEIALEEIVNEHFGITNWTIEE